MRRTFVVAKAAVLRTLVCVVLLTGCKASTRDDKTFPNFDRTVIPVDVEDLGRGIQAGTGGERNFERWNHGLSYQSVAIDSDGDTVTIETHYRDLWPSTSFEIEASGKARKKGWFTRSLLRPKEVGGLVSILRAAASFYREWAPNAPGAQQEAEDIDRMATKVEQLALTVGTETTTVRTTCDGHQGAAYTLNVEGHEYQCHVQDSADCTQHVAVIYDPTNPSHCRPRDVVEHWAFSEWVLLFGQIAWQVPVFLGNLVFLVGGATLFAVSTRKIYRHALSKKH